MAVVCAGPKAILDVPATLEYLETRGVPVVAVGQAELPGFYARSSGHPRRPDVAADVAAAAAIVRTHLGLGLGSGDRSCACRCPRRRHSPLTRPGTPSSGLSARPTRPASAARPDAVAARPDRRADRRRVGPGQHGPDRQRRAGRGRARRPSRLDLTTNRAGTTTLCGTRSRYPRPGARDRHWRLAGDRGAGYTRRHEVVPCQRAPRQGTRAPGSDHRLLRKGCVRMRIYEGSPRQDFEEVFRSIGAFIDQRGMKDVLLARGARRVHRPGPRHPAPPAAPGPSRSGTQVKETLTFLDDDIARFMEEAVARRGRTPPPPLHEAGFYETAFRVHRPVHGRAEAARRLLLRAGRRLRRPPAAWPARPAATTNWSSSPATTSPSSSPRGPSLRRHRRDARPAERSARSNVDPIATGGIAMKALKTVAVALGITLAALIVIPLARAGRPVRLAEAHRGGGRGDPRARSRGRLIDPAAPAPAGGRATRPRTRTPADDRRASDCPRDRRRRRRPPSDASPRSASSSSWSSGPATSSWSRGRSASCRRSASRSCGSSSPRTILLSCCAGARVASGSRVRDMLADRRPRRARLRAATRSCGPRRSGDLGWRLGRAHRHDAGPHCAHRGRDR